MVSLNLRGKKVHAVKLEVVFLIKSLAWIIWDVSGQGDTLRKPFLTGRVIEIIEFSVFLPDPEPWCWLSYELKLDKSIVVNVLIEI